ncbi:MAG: class I SAM-dependent DNA methyltransferase [Bacteroidota bacterium]|nr:class I SAM-dependent DNA methyltransferase [Bacteroidota bacterium]
MFEQAFKNIDDILHKDAGCGSELDYVEQSSWVLFLKYLDDFESARKLEAMLKNETYQPIIADKYRWPNWAAPRTEDGKPDYNKALVGDDLIDFVNLQLFPYLRKFKNEETSPFTIEYKIGEIFGELRNRVSSGYNLREVLWIVDELKFQSSKEKHELSHLYESRIHRMGSAGRNGGEYYTPRPLIRTIVKVVNPEIGNTIYDPACGSAGFLCEAFNYLKKNAKGVDDMDTLQRRTFFGKEKKGLAYIIGIMNMILHGIEAPHIIHTNTLSENLADVQERDRFDVILANPPFGGKERDEVQHNFPIRSSETAYLFMQHFIKRLRAGGRAGIVIKNTFLSNGDNASVALRRKLLEECNLHTILDLPGGVFTGAGVKTVVLFFNKGQSTDKIWYYQLNLDRNLGKTNPLIEKDLAEFVKLQHTQADSESSWSVRVADLDSDTLDLSVKNPNRKEETILRTPAEIAAEMQELNEENALLLNDILSLLK